MCVLCRRTCYCGKACQTADWKAGHKAECKSLVAAAAAATTTTAAVAKTAAAVGGGCGGPDCKRVARPDGAPLEMCAGCLCKLYCSKACQAAGWRAGHNAECKALAAAAAGSKAIAR